LDTCADFDAPRAFQRLYRQCVAVKRAHRLKGEKRGDWEDHPEEGRTFYIGSPQSVAMVRLYEKGRQPEYRHLGRENWARLELQVRPARVAKESFAHVDAMQAWGATKWSSQLAGRVLADHVDPHPAGTTWRLSERDRALEWMCRQYGPHLLSLRADLGDWQSVGLTLSEIIKAQGEA
jgi:DNA relaxase NicK